MPEDWSIPATLQAKPEALAFDLDRTLLSVLSLRAEIPDDAYTAAMLGTERRGSAVLIDASGLVLTIGYLVSEAENVWLTSHDNKAVPAHVLGHDFDSGFGLLQTMGRLDLPPLALGSTKGLGVGSQVTLAAGGGRPAALQTRLIGKREFAGYWEYVLDEALYTAPAHPHWGGAALLDERGRLVGIGSLMIQAEAGDNKTAAGNMAVPIDLLPPILDDLRRHGRRSGPSRPWLGIFATEASDRLVVAGLAPLGPAEEAGLEQGDMILAVAGQPVSDLADLWRTTWDLGEAGVEIPLTIQRDRETITLSITSVDRDRSLKSPKLH
ncbi:serine protease, S1-C subfamily, contains C-terminal PDZ domain [Arboricoccus pini]|uniref:Serine protease, S1-C subfamily, contains C-terminal PDZ domain n=1 Tax=Arboricoccus pini TaxID=1963835 RepID=A0A212QRS7_9PROT|nr:S1C family serine protease [Arboricoccus pini]SNB62301.1 serine protease, S1-C subfamily, contains C-terminal PDZ domain [Arboricoccus pini]